MRAIVWISALFFVTSVVIFLDIPSAFAQHSRNLFLPPNEVRGSAVLYNTQEYTLNFEQQNRLLQILNASSIGNLPKAVDIQPQQVRVYRFNKTNLLLTLYLDPQGGVWIQLDKDQALYFSNSKSLMSLLNEVVQDA